jgi:hypothetical protein
MQYERTFVPPQQGTQSIVRFYPQTPSAPSSFLISVVSSHEIVQAGPQQNGVHSQERHPDAEPRAASSSGLAARRDDANPAALDSGTVLPCLGSIIQHVAVPDSLIRCSA